MLFLPHGFPEETGELTGGRGMLNMTKNAHQNPVSTVQKVRGPSRLTEIFFSRGIFSAPHLLALISNMSLMVAFPAMAKTVDEISVKRGEYIYTMGGCESCHTDESNRQLGPVGGVKLNTDFGAFYTPNITPDRDTGIGGWSDRQFLDAMKKGVSPEGEHYFPSFPYTSYTNMNDEDLLDLKAFLDSLPPVSKAREPHELDFPFNQRWLMGFWKLLFFDQHQFQPVSNRTESWNRGAYIVNGPGHCAECHTPRNLFGGLKGDEHLAGTKNGPDGESVPSINPYKDESFKKWTGEDIVFALKTGMLPDGDFVGGSMGLVVENGTSKLKDGDLSSISEYLRSPEMPGSDGLLSAIHSSTNNVPGKLSAGTSGQSGIAVGMLRWLTWLFVIGGAVWLVAVFFSGNRPDNRKEDASDLVPLEKRSNGID